MTDTSLVITSQQIKQLNNARIGEMSVVSERWIVELVSVEHGMTE